MFSRDTLNTLIDRTYNDYMSRLKPLEKTPRYNLIKVLAAVEAGTYHQLQGDLAFLAAQLFPDSATGEFLRAHWSDRVPPLNASAAVGTVIQNGVVGAAVPAGLIYSSPAGNRFFSTQSYVIGSAGSVEVYVTAEKSGSASNISANTEMTINSAIPVGLTSSAKVSSGGILGGKDGETDAEYLNRVIIYLRNTVRYGKTGDFAAWAVDSSPEVTKAFEIKNFGVFGALLIQCINGNQIDGVNPVQNLGMVQSYIEAVSPPILFTVQTPILIEIIPSIHLLQEEDTVTNRELVGQRLKAYLNVKAVPGISFTQELLKSVIVDGIIITDATLTLPEGKIETTVLQYPILGTIIWL